MTITEEKPVIVLDLAVCEVCAGVKGGYCPSCDPIRAMYRELEEHDTAQATEAERTHQQRVEDALRGKWAFLAPDLYTLEDFLDVIGGADALAAFVIWSTDEGESGPVALFTELNTDTATVFGKAHREAHPLVTSFSCRPDVGLDFGFREQALAFRSAGLNVDDFGPIPTVEALQQHAEGMAQYAEYLDREGEQTAAEWERELEELWERDNKIIAAIEGVEETDDDLDEDAQAALALNPPEDLFALMAGEVEEPDWLEEGIFERGRYYGLTADAKTGKSILAYWLVGHWVQGRSAFDPSRKYTPVKVTYLDAENGGETGEKLRAMGFTPEMLVGGLDRIAYPQFGSNALDTKRDAQLFVERIRAASPDVVVFDTISRFIGGRENDADTWLAMYRLAIAPLRKAGVTVIRLDHTGKNPELGARGNSAKMGDIDVHWILTASGKNSLALKLDRQRSNSHTELVKLTRVDGPLGHIRVPDGKLTLPQVNGRDVPEDDKVAALVVELDRLHISAVSSRRDQQTAYVSKQGTVKAGNNAWAEAVKFRRERIDTEAER